MKSDGVTKVWEFYRDNCAGYKEPMRKELHKLDDYVASVEDENAKLRELMKDALIYLSAWMGYGKPEWMVEKARELGIEVDA